jgi:hypothetical protein
MTRRLRWLGLALLVACIAVAWGALASAGNDTSHRGALAGPWYTPTELKALIEYSNASFAEKRALVGGAVADPVDLSDGGNIHESLGTGPPGERDLERGVAYQASTFPLGIRLRPPDDRWAGVQIQSRRYGFVQLHHLRTGNVPLHGWGYMTIEAAAVPTPAVATVVRRLHATPRLDAGPVTAAHVAGFSGQRFDATVVGTDRPKPLGISVAPYTINRHCGFCTRTMNGKTQDHKYAWKGEVLRVIIIDVRGTTVVIYLESAVANQPDYPDAEVFPTFLPYARQMLSTLEFPK